MKSVTGWLERKLRLKVSATKTKVVRPTKSNFLGFTFWKSCNGWKCRPAEDRKKRLYDKTREILCRRKAAARSIKQTFIMLNWLIRGWINYYRIGSMKIFLEEYGRWLRHKVRVVILKQWKKPKRIYLNLQKLNRIAGCNFTDRRSLQGGKQQIRMVQAVWNVCGELRNQSGDTWKENKGSTGTGQSFRVLPELTLEITLT